VCAPKSSYNSSRKNNVSHKVLMNVDYICDPLDGSNTLLHAVVPVCSTQW